MSVERKEFLNKRKNHYKNEFNMGMLLKKKQNEDEDDMEWDGIGFRKSVDR